MLFDIKYSINLQIFDQIQKFIISIIYIVIIINVLFFFQLLIQDIVKIHTNEIYIYSLIN